MSEQRAYNESLLRPTANLTFLVWLVLIGVPLLLIFLIKGKEYEIHQLERVPVAQVQQAQPVEAAPVTESH